MSGKPGRVWSTRLRRPAIHRTRALAGGSRRHALPVVGARWQGGGMPLPMDAASRYDRKNTPLTKVVDTLPDDAWSQPSPCSGWTAADVLQHVVDTQRDFMLKAGAEMPDPAPVVATGPADAWRTHAEAVARSLADPRIGEKPHETPFGSSTVGQVLDDFYGFDMVVHRWDIARTAGVDARLSDGELDQLDAAADAWGDQLYADGICDRPVDVGGDVDRAVQVLARFGRDAR